MQSYGIDLAKEKFDVSFFDLTSKKVSNQPSHKVVKNNLKSIGRFLETLPSDAVLVAEHTGVYGDTLLKCCMDSNVKIAFVGGYVIHRYRATPDRAKTDVLDCALLREFRRRWCSEPERVPRISERRATMLRPFSSRRRSKSSG